MNRGNNMTTVALNTIRTNFNEVTVDNKVLYFSYNTLVAVSTPEGTYKTSTKYSATTTRHMNKHGLKSWKELDQQTLEALV